MLKGMWTLFALEVFEYIINGKLQSFNTVTKIVHRILEKQL